MPEWLNELQQGLHSFLVYSVEVSLGKACRPLLTWKRASSDIPYCSKGSCGESRQSSETALSYPSSSIKLHKKANLALHGTVVYSPMKAGLYLCFTSSTFETFVSKLKQKKGLNIRQSLHCRDIYLHFRQGIIKESFMEGFH